MRQVETQIQQFLVIYNGNAWLECLQTRINEYIRARGGRSYFSDEENDDDFAPPSIVKKMKLLYYSEALIYHISFVAIGLFVITSSVAKT